MGLYACLPVCLFWGDELLAVAKLFDVDGIPKRDTFYNVVTTASPVFGFVMSTFFAHVRLAFFVLPMGHCRPPARMNELVSRRL